MLWTAHYLWTTIAGPAIGMVAVIDARRGGWQSLKGHLGGWQVHRYREAATGDWFGVRGATVRGDHGADD